MSDRTWKRFGGTGTLNCVHCRRPMDGRHIYKVGASYICFDCWAWIAGEFALAFPDHDPREP